MMKTSSTSPIRWAKRGDYDAFRRTAITWYELDVGTFHIAVYEDSGSDWNWVIQRRGRYSKFPNKVVSNYRKDYATEDYAMQDAELAFIMFFTRLLLDGKEPDQPLTPEVSL